MRVSLYCKILNQHLNSFEKKAGLQALWKFYAHSHSLVVQVFKSIKAQEKNRKYRGRYLKIFIYIEGIDKLHEINEVPHYSVPTYKTICIWCDVSANSRIFGDAVKKYPKCPTLSGETLSGKSDKNFARRIVSPGKVSYNKIIKICLNDFFSLLG